MENQEKLKKNGMALFFFLRAIYLNRWLRTFPFKEITVANHFNIDFNIDKMIYREDVHWYTKYSLIKSSLYNNCKKEPHISSLKKL